MRVCPNIKKHKRMEEECRAAFAKMRLEMDALDSVAAVSCDACGQAWECHYEDVCMVPVHERFRTQQEEEDEEQYATSKPPPIAKENDEKNVKDNEMDYADQSAWCQKCFQQLNRHVQSVCEMSQELANSVTFKATGKPREYMDDWTRRRRRSLAKGRARGRP
jgi:hypothetical protein